MARKYLDLEHAVDRRDAAARLGRPVASRGGFGGQESISLGEAHPTALPPWARRRCTRLEVPASTLHPMVSTLPNGLTLIVQTGGRQRHGQRVRPHPQPPRDRGAERARKGSRRCSSGCSLTAASSSTAWRSSRRSMRSARASTPARISRVQALAEHFDRARGAAGRQRAAPGAAGGGVRRSFATRWRTESPRATRAPAFSLQRSLRAALYPADDPSLRMSTPETVRALTPAAVRAYLQQRISPRSDHHGGHRQGQPQAARATIEKYFGAWSASGPVPPTDLPPAPANAPGSVAVPDASRVQDRVVLAQNLALTRAEADYYPLQLGNAVLGGSFYATRLSIDLRKNAGLVYSVGSVLQAGRTRSVYLVEYASDPQNVVKAADMVAREVTAMQDARRSVPTN